MSLIRPTRCLFAGRASLTPRSIHTSARRLQGNGSSLRKPSPNAKSLGINQPDKYLARKKSRADKEELETRQARNGLAAYTPEERKQLEQIYTPQQIAAIDAGEAAVSLDDIAQQGALRNDPMSLDYIDDFSHIDPVLDQQPKPEVENYDANIKFKDSEDFEKDWAEFIQNLPEDADPVELHKFFDNTRMTIGRPEAELDATDYRAPELPKLTDPVVQAQVRAMAKDDGTDEMKPYYERLSKQTGLSVAAMKRLRVKRLMSRRVVNQTHMGKVPRIHVMTVAGNEDGWLGIGEGKAAEAEDATRLAYLNAIRNMKPVLRYEDRTIFGDVKGKVGATELTLYTRPPGFGVRCQALIYEMARCAGISDLAARVTRSRNPMNTIKATLEALLSQRDPEHIARARGKKLVDVRKVYYAGNT